MEAHPRSWGSVGFDMSIFVPETTDRAFATGDIRESLKWKQHFSEIARYLEQSIPVKYSWMNPRVARMSRWWERRPWINVGSVRGCYY